ncbi:MAG: Transcriptional activator protein CzcR [Syntrophus sp. SKADARSKE-3]|nr:Transcriptional activator protein CzcR [Syntrophus sp. SKADARSKE-3]
MKTLIVEDDFTSRLLLQKLLTAYGECHIAVNGMEAVAAFRTAREEGRPYDLICLDIMMPIMNGHEALREIRTYEESIGLSSSEGVKVIITTSLDDPRNVVGAFKSLCDSYIVKPISKANLLGQVRLLGLVP